jgi:plasmid stabilization system protein ParE
MAYKIVWSNTAKEWLNEQVTFLDENNYPGILENLLESIQKKVKVIQQFPEAGRLSSKKNTRYVKVDKNYHLFYIIKKDNILLLDFFDTRQNPTKRPF